MHTAGHLEQEAYYRPSGETLLSVSREVIPREVNQTETFTTCVPRDGSHVRRTGTAMYAASGTQFARRSYYQEEGSSWYYCSSPQCIPYIIKVVHQTLHALLSDFRAS